MGEVGIGRLSGRGTKIGTRTAGSRIDRENFRRGRVGKILIAVAGDEEVLYSLSLTTSSGVPSCKFFSLRLSAAESQLHGFSFNT